MSTPTHDGNRTGGPKRIVIVGPIPPPPGGVGASIVSFMSALASENNVEATRLEWHEIWRTLSIRPHVVHFNFSKPIKRFLGAIVGRVVGATVVHTVHDNSFDFSHWGNRGALRFSDGFILLNRDIYKRFSQRIDTRNITLLTPILHTAVNTAPKLLDQETSEILDAKGEVKFAVVYAHAKDYRKSIETYGLLFIANILPQIKNAGYCVVFLDPKGEYKTSELDPHDSKNAIHIKRNVDFKSLLNRTDVFLRPTSTDGNAVSILEALEIGVPVIASNSVLRPEGVYQYAYNDSDDFLAVLRRINPVAPENRVKSGPSALSSVGDYLGFLSRLESTNHIEN
jgi:glycosyltransferase involved in cell wall biosynthesis